MQAEALVHDYMGRLKAASWPLPAARREELGGEVAEHIETALAEAGRRDEVTVRNVLERLGAPEEIIAAEARGEPDRTTTVLGAAAAPAAARSPWGAVEIIAMLLLTVGAILLPFVGPLLGLVFVWASTQWTTREKGIATVIVFTLFAVPVLLLAVLGA